MKLGIFTTGGTIDKVYFDAKSEFQVGASGIEGILREGNFQVPYSVESVLRKDSLDMTTEDRTRIHDAIAASDATHCLVTHGTDTMVQTAQVVSALKDRCIVFTGAMQPANFKNSDAVFNVGFALGVLSRAAPGTYIAMNGEVFEPFKVRKNVAANRFEKLP